MNRLRRSDFNIHIDFNATDLLHMKIKYFLPLFLLFQKKYKYKARANGIRKREDGTYHMAKILNASRICIEPKNNKKKNKTISIFKLKKEEKGEKTPSSHTTHVQFVFVTHNSLEKNFFLNHLTLLFIFFNIC